MNGYPLSCPSGEHFAAGPGYAVRPSLIGKAKENSIGQILLLPLLRGRDREGSVSDFLKCSRLKRLRAQERMREKLTAMNPGPLRMRTFPSFSGKSFPFGDRYSPGRDVRGGSSGAEAVLSLSVSTGMRIFERWGEAGSFPGHGQHLPVQRRLRPLQAQISCGPLI